MVDNTEAQDEGLAMYRAQVRNAVLTNSITPFPNKSPLHARIIVQEFVRAAHRNVDIFCGKLSNVVYGGDDTFAVFERVIQLGVKVRVVLQHGDKLENRKLANLIRENSGEVRRLAPETKGSTPTGHFFIVDGKRYRYELDGDARSAFACANSGEDDTVLNFLQGLFERYIEKATPIS